MKLSDISIHAWMQEHGIRTETGEPFSFDEHLFWFDVLRDDSPKQVWYKAAQVGGSTAAILKTFYSIKRYGLDAIYTLPTADDVKSFVGSKVNRIVANNPILQQYVADKDTIEQKRIGDNVIYYRGTMTERAAIMVSSDLNVYDEEDRSRQDIIQQYASRLQHSKFKWEWHFSNPSVPGNGVSRYWDQSDQKHWVVKCSACNEQQDLTWPDSICPKRRVFQCKRCKAELSNRQRARGEWKAWSDGEYSGYWFSLLMAPWVTAGEILYAHEKKSADFFYNFVLGLPYVGEGNKVMPEDIFKNVVPKIERSPQDRIVIGCDSGIKKHFVVGTRKGVLTCGVTQSWEDIERMLVRYPNAIAVLDAMPDITEPRRLRDKYRGRVFLCHYARDRKTMQLVRWGEGDELGSVLVDRNRMMQTCVDDIQAGKAPLQGTRDDYALMASQFSTLYRQSTTDALGTPVFQWETSDGNDHLAHAYLYYRVGLSRFADGSGEIFVGEEKKRYTSVEVLEDGRIHTHIPSLILPERPPTDWRNS